MMYTDPYICSDNHNLTKIPTKINFSWQTKYVGRKINRNKYEQIFDINGHYLENDEYDKNDIIVNIKPSIDDDDYITSFSHYKIKDLTSGHGRPVTKDLSLTRADISALSQILDSVTENHVEKEYKTLCESFRQEEHLPGEYNFRKVTKSGISLTNKNSDVVSLTIAKILKALYISHEFIDVLFSEEMLKEASNCFEAEDIPLYLAILSKVDYSEYRNFEVLFEEANNRKLIRRASIGYSALLKSVKENNLDEAKKNIEFSKIVIADLDRNETPLMLAVSNDNIEMVQLLLANGAYSTESFINDERISISPLLIAAQRKNYQIMELVAKYRGAETYLIKHYSDYNPVVNFSINDVFAYISSQKDYEAIKIILPYALNGVFDPSTLSDISLKKMKTLSEIKGARIRWTLKLIKKAYVHDRLLCKAMLEQGSTVDVVEYLIKMDDFEMFSICIENHLGIRLSTAFELVYQRDSKWYEKLFEYSDPFNNHMGIRLHRDKYLEKLIANKEFDKYINITTNLGLGIPIESLFAFCNYPKNKPFNPALNQFLKYVLNHIEHEESSDNGSTISYGCFDWYREVIFDHGTAELCTEFLEKYPVRLREDNEFFESLCHSVIQREDQVFLTIIKMKMDLYDDDEKMNEALWGLLDSIFTQYAHVEKLSKSEYYKKNRSKKIIQEINHYIDELRQFSSIIKVNSLTNAMLLNKSRNYPATKTIYDYAVANGITGKKFLSFFQS